MSWGKFVLVELGMHVEPFVGGSNPLNSGKKKAQFCMHKNYKFDKCTLIIK